MAYEIPTSIDPPSMDSLLPELNEVVIADLFAESKLGGIAVVRFWQNESQKQIDEALRSALKVLAPDEVISLIPDIEELVESTANDGDCGHFENIWDPPKELQVDEDGFIIGRVGHISILGEVFERPAVMERFIDDFFSYSRFANLRVNTADVVIAQDVALQNDEFLSERIDREENRRLRL